MPVRVSDTGSLITRYLHFLLRVTLQDKNPVALCIPRNMESVE